MEQVMRPSQLYTTQPNQHLEFWSLSRTQKIPLNGVEKWEKKSPKIKFHRAVFFFSSNSMTICWCSQTKFISDRFGLAKACEKCSKGMKSFCWNLEKTVNSAMQSHRHESVANQREHRRRHAHATKRFYRSIGRVFLRLKAIIRVINFPFSHFIIIGEWRVDPWKQ